MSPLGDERGVWVKRLTGIHRMGHPILCWGHPLVDIHMGCKYLHIFCPFREFYLFSSSLNFFATNFPIMFQVSDHPAKPLAAAHELVHNCTSSHFSFQAKWTTKVLLRVLPTRKASLHRCPGMSQRGVVMLQVSTLEWYLSIIHKHLWAWPKSSLSLSTGCRELCMRPFMQAGGENGDRGHLGHFFM